MLTPQTLSAGYSYGDYKDLGVTVTGAGYLFRSCSWLNADVGFEWRSPGRIVLRAFFGASKLLNSRAPVWHEADVVPNMESGFGSMRQRYPLLPLRSHLGRLSCRKKAAAICCRVAPTATNPCTSKSSETAGSPASTLATRD
jgi:hypothetical protein